MPLSDPLGGNLVASVTQRPYWSTFGPWLPGHWYQKSSTLTYWKPASARPLVFMASAWASMLAAVGSCRMKLQLLQPSAGVSPTPLASFTTPGAAVAAGAALAALAAGAAIRMA